MSSAFKVRYEVIVSLLGLFAVGIGGCGKSKATTLQCVLNSDCSGALVCAQGYCVTACVTSRDCAGSARCISLPDLGNVCQAFEKEKCSYNSECSPLVCGVDLECRNQCQTDVDCPSGQKCTTTSKQCVDPIKDSSHYDPVTNELIPPPDAGVRDAGSSGHAGAGGTGASGGAQGSAGTGGAAAGQGGAAAAGAGGHGGNGGAAGAKGAGGAAGAVGGGGTAGGGLGGTQFPPATWRLWVIEKTTNHIYGYNPAQLVGTNGDAPEIDLSVPGGNTPYHIEFDPSGSMWISLGNGGFASLWKVDASQLAASGAVTPVAVLNLPNFTVWTGPLAFDGAGNLWVNEPNTGNPYDQPGTLARFNATTVAKLTATSVAVNPDFSITTWSGRPGLDVDGAGNVYTLLAGASGPLGRYDAAQLVGSGSITDPPALTIPSFSSVNGSAFDLLLISSGLAAAANDLYLFTKSQIAQSGAPASLPPQAHITLAGVTGFPVSYLAIDPDGNMFVAGGQNKVFKLAAADIAAATGAVALTPLMNLRPPTSNPSATFGAMAVH